MASSDAMPVPRKNVAYRVTFPIYDADGDLVTGASSLDSEVSKDGGAMADCTNEATEIGSTGIYYLDLTSTEMNADCVALQVKTGTAGAKTTVIILYPEEAGDIRTDVVQISGDSTAADNAEAMFDGNGYAGGTTKLGVDVVAVSGDSTAADNLEAAYDGNGYIGNYIRRSTAQAGAASTITLDASASATNDLYNGLIIAIVGGTGAGQARYISDYVGATKVATVSESWITNPDNTSVFVLLPNARQVTPRKAAAYVVVFLMIDSSDDISGKTGLTPTMTVSKDGGAFSACSNSPSEIANGLYKITLTATEMDADVVVVKAVAAGANTSFERLITIP